MTTKQVTTELSGFTPCPDVLIEKYSHTTALVWGKIWRYCQMKDEVCNASILRLAKELGITDDTIQKHIKLLETGGYIKDLTPDLRNKPHTYVDTEKLRIKITIGMDETTTEKFGTGNLGSDTRKIRHEESTTTGGSNLFSLYENNIGPITSFIADALQEAEKIYPDQWIADAIRLAVENNKRNWRYCETILKRWQADGKDDGKKKPEPKPAQSVPDFGDWERQYA